MEGLSNEFLVKAYIQARVLKLDPDFISLLEKEIKKRELLLIRYRKDEWKAVV
ncbi:sporulation histidine kinase inhibitor Sda [Bacillus taeanensis]|uniref:Sporulation histidine kinase inhibitor Sda n=1 Tax=Bacillus taeanensis TaxID=273032 RepID=A0A366XU31_9BACI|nr:sporulation histidine kinase inhibitor Sda [Bacillus taeanensis]RBW68655.1 sporulation histidine kinase inhibitor Sda [Bacillus taeanensis]